MRTKKMSMNKFIKTTMLATAGAALVTQVAQAANNDLILGFTQAGGTTDYIIDLGQATAVGVNGTSVIDISGYINQSTFTSAFGAGNNVSASVVGGKNGSTATLYVTATRSGAGNNAMPNSTTPNPGLDATSLSTMGAQANSLGITYTAGTGTTIGNGAANSFTVGILNNYASEGSIDPRTALTGTIFEDLWFNHVTAGTAQGWVYEGYFTINEGTPTLTFTPAGFVPVPEPATYGVLAGAGLLALCLRRQLGLVSA
jgi:hypothetical protein